MRNSILILLLLLPALIRAQAEDNIWAFGYGTGLDLNSGTPVLLPGFMTNVAEGTASISDADGNLLFYSAGQQVWNKDHELMPNGSGILGHEGSGTQSVAISKYPGSDSLYYLFTLENYEMIYLGTSIGYLRYNIIDMSLDGGLGDVITTEKNILMDSFMGEKMVVVKDNRCGYWLVTYNYSENTYHSYRITEEGIEPPVISYGESDCGMMGEIKISPDGSKIVNAGYAESMVELASFDVTTGEVSDFISWTRGYSYGAGFSPNSKVLYTTHFLEVYQYDLSAFPDESAILASEYLVSSEVGISTLRLATNGKIYSMNYAVFGTASIDVIHAPNELGADCDFEVHAIMVDTGSIGIGTGSSIAVNEDIETTIGDTYDTLACYRDSMILEAPLGYPVYVWDDGSSLPTRTVYGSGTYWVRYGTICIQTVDSYHVNMPDSNISVHNNDTVVCTGSVVDLIADDVSGYVYEWMPSEGIADPASAVTTIEATESGTLTLQVNYPGCAPFYRSFDMEVKEVPVVEMPENTTICLGKGYEAYPYIPGADEDYTYSWAPATGVSDPSSKDVVLSPEVTTTYYLTVNSGAEDCDVVDSVRVSVIPNSIELVNNDTALCSGISIPINVDGHPLFTYYWTPEDGIADPHQANSSITPSASGWVTITASREGCDDMTDSFYIDLQPVPEVNAGSDDTLCGGVSYQLFGSVTPPDYDTYTYEWTPPTFLSDPSIKDPWFTSYTSSEELILRVGTPFGCERRDTVLLTVVPKRSVLLNVTDTGYCPAGWVQLEASNAESYVWIPSTGLSDDNIPNPVAAPDESVEYMVIGYTAGCMDTQFVNIEVYPNASLYMPDSVTIYPGEAYQMDVESNASYYSWYPPEGLSDVNIANPLVSPYVRTRYFVTASTEYGCTVTDSIDIIVDNGYIFEVPNAFVPGNSFSKNGSFRILKRGKVRLARFEVYDRWGVKVFETSDIEKGWDGRYDGKAQPMGVYIYLIEGILPDGQKVQLHGNVTLIR